MCVFYHFHLFCESRIASHESLLACQNSQFGSFAAALSPPPPSFTMPFTLEKLIRPNILALLPYRCARDDYDSGVLLDANENAYGPALANQVDGNLNRYPDPYHVRVKERLIKYRNLPSINQVFLGVGSDEVIDLVLRICCVPSKDKILITPPTYGMYSVCAQINDVGVVKSNLDVENGAFQVRTEDVSTSVICCINRVIDEITGDCQNQSRSYHQGCFPLFTRQPNWYLLKA